MHARVALVLALCALGCTAKNPGAGGGGGNGIGGGPNDRDGAAEFDAAVADASPDELPPGCIAIDEDDESNTLTVVEGTGTEEARAFVPKYAFATWSTFEECTRGSVVIGLGANSCSPTNGPRFLVTIDEGDVGTAVFAGINLVGDSPAGLVQTDFIAPDSEDDDLAEDLWGNCTGSFGDIVFDDIDEPGAGAAFTADISLTLEGCVNNATVLPVEISAKIAVTLEETRAEYCERVFPE